VICLLLLGAALADDELEAAAEATTIPPAPQREGDHPHDCTAKASAPAGTSRDCDAISVPPAYLAYLEATRVYAEQLQLHLVACQASAATDAQHCDDALAWRDTLITDLQQPVPLLERPGVQVGLGVVGGALLTVGAGWALGQAAQ
jgi:hypothetical protein